MVKGLSKTVRMFRDVYNLLKRIQIYLSEETTCPQLRADVNELLDQVKDYISI